MDPILITLIVLAVAGLGAVVWWLAKRSGGKLPSDCTTAPDPSCSTPSEHDGPLLLEALHGFIQIAYASADDDVHQAAIIGVLMAALEHVIAQSDMGTRAAVHMARHGCHQSSELRSAFEALQSLAPSPLATVPDLDRTSIQSGRDAAYDLIRSLPDADNAHASQQIGAAFGTFAALVELGGFDETLFDASEVARYATKLDATRLTYGDDAFRTPTTQDN